MITTIFTVKVGKSLTISVKKYEIVYEKNSQKIQYLVTAVDNPNRNQNVHTKFDNLKPNQYHHLYNTDSLNRLFCFFFDGNIGEIPNQKAKIHHKIIDVTVPKNKV